MQSYHAAIWALVLLVAITLQPVAAQYGATYLGCFSFSRLLYLRGMENAKPVTQNKAKVGTCLLGCREKGYSLSIVATDFRCWCGMATPPPMAQMEDAACQPGSSKGALVFYLHEGAQACRVQELDTVPSNFAAAPQSQSQSAAVFDPLAQSMVLHPKSDGPQRLTAKFPVQLYGQFEVSARISVHPSSYTSIDIQEADATGAQAKAPSTDDISWQFTNTTAWGIGKNMQMGSASRSRSAVSALEHLLKPTQYKTLSGLKQEENLGNTWATYTIDWQSDRVTWAMNGVPLLTQWSAGKAKPGMLPQSSAAAGSKRSLLSPEPQGTGQQQKHQQHRKNAKAAAQQQARQPDQQQQQPWTPPSKPALFSFGVRLNPKSGIVEGAQQQPAMQSSFMEVRRIVCDKPRVRGDKGPVVPTWFLLGQGWELEQQQQQQQKPQAQKAKQQQKQEQQKKQLAKVQAKENNLPPGSDSRSSGINRPHRPSSSSDSRSRTPSKAHQAGIGPCRNCQPESQRHKDPQMYALEHPGHNGKADRTYSQARHQEGYSASAWEHEQRQTQHSKAREEQHPGKEEDDWFLEMERAEAQEDDTPQRSEAWRPDSAHQEAEVDWERMWREEADAEEDGSQDSPLSRDLDVDRDAADVETQQRLSQAYLLWHDSAPAAGYRTAEPSHVLQVEFDEGSPLQGEDEPQWPAEMDI